MAAPTPLGGHAAYPSAPGAGSAGPQVVVNIYTLMNKESAPARVGNDVLDLVGMSIYHAGVEILGQEYAFGMDPSGRPDPNIDGIFTVRPRRAVGDFKEAVVLGTMPVNFGPAELQQVIASLKPLWKAVTYHILNRNCCHFAKDFALALDPSFERTFPNYVCRAASIGEAIVPDALVEKITSLIAPPPAVPPHLVNVVDFPWPDAVPPAARFNQSAVPPAAAPRPAQPKPVSPFSLFQTAGLALVAGARMAASVVSETVGTLATEADRKTFAQLFPQCNPALLRKTFTTDVVYLLREYEATIFVASDCLALTGPPQLAVVIPMSDIVSMCHARFIPPPAPRLPPSFELTDSSVAENPGIFLYRRSRPGMVAPLFKFRTFGSSVSESVSKVVGADYTTVTLEAFKLINELWIASGAGQAR